MYSHKDFFFTDRRSANISVIIWLIIKPLLNPHGGARVTWSYRWARPQESRVRVWDPNCSQLHHFSSAAAGLLSQRVASQKRQIGTCKSYRAECEMQMNGSTWCFHHFLYVLLASLPRLKNHSC